jgi:DNA-binding NarL/FixJ family response regulator
MKRVFLADAHPDERRALRLLLTHLEMKVVGEAADWSTVLGQAAALQPDMVLVEWGLVNQDRGLLDLRKACSPAVKIVLISSLDDWQQAAQFSGADEFISKGETSDRVAERLQAAAANIGLE